MTNEQQFFLDMLSDHLHQRDTRLPADMLDWQIILNYAKSHQVEGLLWHQCKNCLLKREDDYHILQQLKSASYSNMISYAYNLEALKELEEAFKEAHIPFFTVKGLDIAALYPVPAFRTMGDLDIVMNKKDRSFINGIMTDLGYKSINSKYELCYFRHGSNVEIHDHLVYKENQETRKVREYFDSCWKHVKEGRDGRLLLDWDYHFVFLVEHLKKHFCGNGIGFRQFIDITVIIQKIEDLDWKTIEADLRKIGLWDFTLTVLSFCKRWFAITTPFDTPDLGLSFYEEATELIFKNGVFGFDHERHQEHAIGRRLRVSKFPKLFVKINIIRKEVFIPYEYIIKLPYCRFLIGKKYLLPIAWIYRIFFVVRNKRIQLDAERILLFKSDDVIEQHNMLMKKWGL